jgi:hypothetical protein
VVDVSLAQSAALADVTDDLSQMTTGDGSHGRGSLPAMPQRRAPALPAPARNPSTETLKSTALVHR